MFEVQPDGQPTKEKKKRAKKVPVAKQEPAAAEPVLLPAPVVVVPVPPPEPVKLTAIQKVNLMSSLASLAEDNDLKELLTSKKNGEMVYADFMKFIERRLTDLMSDTKSEEMSIQIANLEARLKHVTNVLGYLGDRMDILLREMHRWLTNFMGTPIVKVISMLNEKVGGAAFAFTPDNLAPTPAPPAPVLNAPAAPPAPPPMPVQAPVQQIPQQAPQPMPVQPRVPTTPPPGLPMGSRVINRPAPPPPDQDYNGPGGGGGGRRGGGLGSF